MIYLKNCSFDVKQQSLKYLNLPKSSFFFGVTKHSFKVCLSMLHMFQKIFKVYRLQMLLVLSSLGTLIINLISFYLFHLSSLYFLSLQQTSDGVGCAVFDELLTITVEQLHHWHQLCMNN